MTSDKDSPAGAVIFSSRVRSELTDCGRGRVPTLHPLSFFLPLGSFNIQRETRPHHAPGPQRLGHGSGALVLSTYPS